MHCIPGINGRVLHTALLLLFTMPATGSLGETWCQSSYEDFRQGLSDDGGVQLYPAADGTVRTSLSFDYNQDGSNDILYVCSHDNWYAPPAYVYTNNDGAFDPRFRWELLNEGAHGGLIEDFNADGWQDIILCGTMNGMNFAGLEAVVYYGDNKGYARERSTRLPTDTSRSVVAIDANADGLKDLAFAMQRGRGIRIYLQQADGFNPNKYIDYDIGPCTCIAVADIDNDGLEDLLALSGSELIAYRGTKEGVSCDIPSIRFDTGGAGRFVAQDINKDGHTDIVVTDDGSDNAHVTIHWGTSKTDFETRPPTQLPSDHSRDIAVADLNRDGFIDVVVANEGEDDGSEDAQSFIYFGGTDGFTSDNRLVLDTGFAGGVAAIDANNDGWIDLVMARRHNGASYDVDSYVYFNKQGSFSDNERITLPTHGAIGVTAGDIDRNGEPDLLFFNSVDGTKGLSQARLYWNDGAGRFSAERMTQLPIRDAFGHVTADLNLDGNLDIVFANSYEYGRYREEGSYVYWGNTDGVWSPDHRSIIPTQFAVSVITSDLNRDGWLDLAFGQLVSWKPGFKAEDRYSVVYYGSKDGFSAERCVQLPVEDPRGLTAADFNKDGWIDLAFSNLSYPDVPIYWGSAEGYSTERCTRLVLPVPGSVTLNSADLNADGWLDLIVIGHESETEGGQRTADRFSYVLLGSANGFDVDRRIDLPSMGAQGSSVADFNHDGLLDVFIPSYTEGYKTRTWTSFLYYNDLAGFSASKRTSLLTNSGSGAVALDYNKDGWLDLAVACHMLPNGNHRADSFLFYGSDRGFSDNDKLALPTEGSHDITYMDPGHIYNRRFEYTYTSAVHDTGQHSRITALNWSGTTRHGSALKFQVRAGDTTDSVLTADWIGPKGNNSYFEQGGDTGGHCAGRYVQYRAVFSSTDGSNYPVLDSVDLEYLP